MADRKQIGSSAGLIDLKAELFRKQEELRQAKAKSAADWTKGKKTEQHGKKDIWNKKNSGVQGRATKDLAEKQEEEDIMEKSRKALEEKSKIYDKIASFTGIPDEDGSEGYLVDFQKKAVDRLVEERTGVKEPETITSAQGEEWVDYVDTFGKARTCLKEDLIHMQQLKDDAVVNDGQLKLKEGATLLSADMKRELRRQQWEKEAEEAAKNGPIHYANVQFDEIRTHGTGFYQFSKDDNLRQEQMDLLNDIREQTKQAQDLSQRIKEKRKAAMEARLAKVRERRRQAGLPVPDEPAVMAETSAVKEEVKPVEPLTRDDSWRQTAPIRDWDKGKQEMPKWNAERYMEERRQERNESFAPPQFYFDQQQQPSTRKKQTQVGKPRGDTEAMLKQIRLATADSLVACQSPEIADNVLGQTGLEPGTVDLDVIPLPGHQPSPVVDQSFSGTESQQGTGATSPAALLLPSQFSLDQQNSISLNAEVSPHGFHTDPHPTSFWPPPHDMLQQNYPMPQPEWPPVWQPPASTTTTPAASFRYPSQEGLLTAQQQQWPGFASVGHTSVNNSSTVSIGVKDKPKNAMVDKRFMQNKEASESDLLGYMAQGKDNTLMGIQPIAYQPGIFSAETQDSNTTTTDRAPGQRGTLAVVSDGVVFGVPDFLQPAADVEAKMYEPGSFMAAKRAAAQKAEEEYQIARKKTQYSCEPVLYNTGSGTQNSSI